MNVPLTPELEKLVSARIQSGRFHSAGEVIAQALYLLEESEKTREEQIREFNEELKRRIAAADRGEFVDPAEARERLRKISEDYRNSDR